MAPMGAIVERSILGLAHFRGEPAQRNGEAPRIGIEVVHYPLSQSTIRVSIAFGAILIFTS
jgi:hypothetical protein